MSACPDQSANECIAAQSCLIGDNTLTIAPLTRSGTVLSWDLSKIPEVAGMAPPIEVKIDYSRTGAPAGPWMMLRDWSDSGSDFTVDRQILAGSDFSLFYRLSLRDSVGDIRVGRSQHVFSTVPGRLGPTYREVLRRWFERSRSGELRSGYLIRRHRWGLLCPACTDRDGRQKIRSQCIECFDSGFVGGFTQAGDCFFVEAKGTQLSENFKFEQGWYQEGPVARFLFLNIPAVYPGDMWVDKHTDERWVIGNPLAHSMRIGSMDVMGSAPAARLDSKHVFYDFEVTR